MTTPLFLPIGIGGGGVDVAIFKDVKASGTDGGTFTSGAWRTRDLNTQTGNTSIASLATNTITILEAGDYYIFALAPGRRVQTHKARLNINSGSSFVYGSSQSSNTASGDDTRSEIFYIGSFSVNDTILLEHYSNATNATKGFGNSVGIATVDEVYSQLALIKIT